MTNRTHLEILRRAADGKLPDQIEENGEMDIGAFRELYEGRLVDAIDATSKDGCAYLNLRITLAGREYLSSQKSWWQSLTEWLLKPVIVTVLGSLVVAVVLALWQWLF